LGGDGLRVSALIAGYLNSLFNAETQRREERVLLR
jgi:hypothetical protein